jgi:protein TonB
MNEAMQRMVPAILFTIGLHGALLSWRMQQPPPTVRPKPLPQKITVSLTRLPPPAPPLKKIVQEVPSLPQLAAAEYQPIKPIVPKPKPLKKIVQKVPSLPKLAQVQHQAIRPVKLQPGKKISTKLPVLPKIAPVTQQEIKPLKVVKPIPRPEPQRIPTPVRTIAPVVSRQQSSTVVRQAQPVVSRQQPVVRRATTYQRTQSTYRQPVSTRQVRTRQVLASTPSRTTSGRTVRTTNQTTKRATPAKNTGVVREAAPLYQSNPPPEYPRMARRRGLEGVVTIEAKVDPNGRVAELRLFASSGHSLLDKAALKAVRGWKFSPGTVGGRAQSMWVKVPVRFQLH